MERDLRVSHSITVFLLYEVHPTLHRVWSSKNTKPVVYTTIYPLEDMAKGLDALANRQTWGKVIVRVKNEGNGNGAKL